VAGGGDPGRPVHIQPHIVVPAQHPLPGVQAHPHPHRPPRRPVVGGQPPLGGHRRPDRPHRATEGHKERVALGTDLHPPAPRDRPAHDRRVLVPDPRVPVPQLLQQPGGALDVGEQEGDRPGRQRRPRPDRRLGRRQLGRCLPAAAQLQAQSEQHRGHAEHRDHAPQDAGGRGQRLARGGPLGGGDGDRDDAAEHRGRDDATVLAKIGWTAVASNRLTRTWSTHKAASLGLLSNASTHPMEWVAAQHLHHLVPLPSSRIRATSSGGLQCGEMSLVGQHDATCAGDGLDVGLTIRGARPSWSP
jgi:hypothetical protein